MNGAHAHLLVNHIPLFGVSFGFIALIWSVVRNSKEMRWAAIALFLCAGISGWIAMETGESAEKLVEHLPGVTEAFLSAHEEAAEFANISATVLAVAALLMAALSRFRPQFVKAAQYATLVLALLSSAAMARTAFLGGQIRHTEIRSVMGDGSSGAPAPTGEENEKDD